MATGRSLLVRLHRCAGLALAAFLTVAGLTGAVIAFQDELDAWLNPHLMRTGPGTAFGSPYDFVEAVERDDPRGRVTFATLRFQEGRSALYFVKPRVDPATGRLHRLGYNQVFVDPTSGTIMGKRHWGAFAWDREHLLPSLYEIHYSLFLPEALSGWFLGLIAFVWLVDSAVGLALTVPRGRPRLAQWLRGWTPKRDGGAYRRTFDLHRAGGLWFWLVLVLLAATGFYLRVGDEVVRPLLLQVSSLTPTPHELREDRPPTDPVEPVHDFRSIVELATRERDRLGWTAPPSSASYDHLAGIYAVSFQLPEYAERNVGAPTIHMDGVTGAVLGHGWPLTGTAADVIIDLPRPLHGGKLGGLPGRILVASAGLATAVLSVTGVVIFLRKRRARLQPASA